MNLKTMAVGLLLSGTTLFSSCTKEAKVGQKMAKEAQKALTEVVAGAEKFSTKGDLAYLSKETLASFNKHYTPVDTFKVSDFKRTDVGSAKIDSAMNQEVKSWNASNAKKIVNKDGNPVLIMDVPLYESGKGHKVVGKTRDAIQFDSDAKVTKLSYFIDKGNSQTSLNQNYERLMIKTPSNSTIKIGDYAFDPKTGAECTLNN